MWGGAYERRGGVGDGRCFDWHGGRGYFTDALSGAHCDQNWLSGMIGGGGDRPFQSPSPALLGFDETINERCSGMLGYEPWDDEDLNWKIAARCRDAHRNVLRQMDGGWDMCTNLTWQLCAVQGKLPGQGSKKVPSFSHDTLTLIPTLTLTLSYTL